MTAALFAFATPTQAVLQKIMEAGSPVLEMGAGVGYWAALLRLGKKTVHCTDIAPPSGNAAAQTTESIGSKAPKSRKRPRRTSNEYHGQVPAWTLVDTSSFEETGQIAREMMESARPTKKRKRPEEAPTVEPRDVPMLLLCYPPPLSDGAFVAVSQFLRFSRSVARDESQREVDLVLVGEFAGLTANRRFEQLLATEFHLRQEFRLPQWGNTCASATFWRAQRSRSGGGEREAHAPLEDCHVACSICTTRSWRSRRCSLARDVVFCSEACAVGLQGRACLQLSLASAGIFVEDSSVGESSMSTASETAMDDQSILRLWRDPEIFTPLSTLRAPV